MLTEPTIDKLHFMRLAAMASAWLGQQKDPKLGALSFDERFTMLVEAEFAARDNRRLARLLKDASLRIPNACIEDVRISPQRGIDRAMLRQLATCGWIGEHLNVLITGPTGVGKSYLASALGQAACRRGIRVLYRRTPRLFDELALARADGSYARVLSRLAKADLLILDDLGLGGAQKEAQRHDLLEVLEDRYGRALHDHHEPARREEVARVDRRPDHRRRDSGPHRPQRLQAPAHGPLGPEGEAAQADLNCDDLRRFAPITTTRSR